MHHSWFTEKNIAMPCPQNPFCRRKEKRAGAWGKNPDVPQHTLCGRALSRTWKEGADDLSATATRSYKPLAIKAGVGRLKAKQQETNRLQSQA